MYFSAKFKQLRKSHDLTQEQIADIFHVSPQTVSRWETGENHPNIELLPHVAKYFKVSVDELLGMELIFDDDRAGEYIAKIRKHLTLGQLSEAVALARKAAGEFPAAYYDLHLELFETLCVQPTEEYKDEIIELAERIIRFCKQDDISLQVRARLFKQYVKWGMVDEAKKIVMTLPSEHWYTRVANIGDVLEGDEWRQHQQTLIAQYTNLLCWAIQDYSHRAEANTAQKIEWIKKIIQIYSVVFDDETDAILYTYRVHYHVNIARMYCQVGDVVNALLYVEKATADAVHYCTAQFTGYKSSLLVGRSYGHEHHARANTKNECWQLWEDVLTCWEDFGIVREHERFLKCIEMLKSHSNEIKDFWS